VGTYCTRLQFDARNYGSPIAAAQEVLQRDTTDITAKSIMAVSGLRVSASALEQCGSRMHQWVGSTRDEAQRWRASCATHWAEPFFPRQSPPPAEKPVVRPPVRRAVPNASATPEAEPKRNPFDALKG
jgi:hypothetical protein